MDDWCRLGAARFRVGNYCMPAKPYTKAQVESVVAYAKANPTVMIRTIAKRMGINYSTVWAWLNKNGITRADCRFRNDSKESAEKQAARLVQQQRREEWKRERRKQVIAAREKAKAATRDALLSKRRGYQVTTLTLAELREQQKSDLAKEKRE